jgi:hypothetical protein
MDKFSLPLKIESPVYTSWQTTGIYNPTLKASSHLCMLVRVKNISDFWL